MSHVWGYDFAPNTNVVDVCIKRIRKKISLVNDDESPIESIRGVGYRFKKCNTNP
jgi:DNA-binding response OmpR family regulator